MPTASTAVAVVVQLSARLLSVGLTAIVIAAAAEAVSPGLRVVMTFR